MLTNHRIRARDIKHGDIVVTDTGSMAEVAHTSRVAGSKAHVLIFARHDGTCTTLIRHHAASVTVARMTRED